MLQDIIFITFVCCTFYLNGALWFALISFHTLIMYSINFTFYLSSITKCQHYIWCQTVLPLQ